VVTIEAWLPWLCGYLGSCWAALAAVEVPGWSLHWARGRHGNEADWTCHTLHSVLDTVSVHSNNYIQFTMRLLNLEILTQDQNVHHTIIIIIIIFQNAKRIHISKPKLISKIHLSEGYLFMFFTNLFVVIFYFMTLSKIFQSFSINFWLKTNKDNCMVWSISVTNSVCVKAYWNDVKYAEYSVQVCESFQRQKNYWWQVKHSLLTSG